MLCAVGSCRQQTWRGSKEGKEKKKRADRDAMKRSTLAQSFLGLFRKKNETEKPSQQEAAPRSWSLPVPILGRGPDQ